MKLLIAGSRDYPVFGNFLRSMSDFVSMYGMPSEVISGNCHVGPDKFGEAWAEANSIPVKLINADWVKYKKAAGPIRNKEMAEYCTRAIVFWDGKSKGSKNMIDELQKHNKPYTVIYPQS